MTTLTVTTTFDYSGTALSNIDVIDFDNLVGFITATFANTQFDGVAILDNVQLDGSVNGFRMRVVGGSVDASGWTFTNWNRGVDMASFPIGQHLINLIGGAGADTITGSPEVDLIEGGPGGDTLSGGGFGGTFGDVLSYRGSPSGVTVDLGANTASGGDAQNDTISGFDSLTGSDHADTVTGNGGVNVIEGGGGGDTLNGAGGNDFLSGDSGSDTVIGGTGDDVLDGGAGIDTADYAAAAGSGVTVNLYNGLSQLISASQGTDQLIDFENATGSAQADILTGNTGVNTLTGNGGGDILNGAAGADTLIGGDNNDAYYIDALDTVTEGSGVNSGTDTIYAKFNIDLASHANVENLVLYGGGPTSGIGTTANNVMNALSNTNGVTFNGNDGNDVLYGSNYGDTLNGGGGRDVMFGYADLGGVNTMNGGDDNDAYYSSRTNDVINENLNEGFDIVFATVNRILSANTEYLYLYGTATSGTGNSLANTINGFNSAQSLTLDGAQGNDVIYGSNQNDVIIGGTENDVMNGYGGTDTFRFAAAGTGTDQIYGFDADPTGGQDLIDVSGRGFNAGSIGTAIIISASGANTLITIGADTILLHAVAAANVTATDFLF